MPSVIKALRSVRVPVVAVADFDVLQNENELRRIVDSLKGDFSLFERDLTILSAALKSTPKSLQRLALKDELARQLGSSPEPVVDQKEAERLRGLFKTESGWDKAKKGGLRTLPQGDAAEAAQNLLDGLESLGLLVVPVGELERFATTVGGHGPAWVTEVLEKKLHTTPSSDAESFVGKLRAAAYNAAGLPLDSV